MTIAARATEVAVLQAKKSSSNAKKTSARKSPSAGGNSGGKSFSGNGSNGGKSSSRKSGGQIAGDVVETLFDNSKQIVGITPFTKAGSIGANHILTTQVAKIFGEKATFSSTLATTGGKFIPYGFAAYAWVQTTISIFGDDPVQRAEQRGYTLK